MKGEPRGYSYRLCPAKKGDMRVNACERLDAPTIYLYTYCICIHVCASPAEGVNSAHSTNAVQGPASEAIGLRAV